MKTSQQIVKLISPGWLAAVLSSIVAVAIIGVSIIATRGSNSAILDGFFVVQTASSSSYRDIADRLAANEIISNAPLFLFWLVAGLIIYATAIKIYAGFNSARAVRQELDYVNVDKRAIVREAVVNLLVRLTVAGVWLIYITLFFRMVVPYALTASKAAAQLSEPIDIFYVILAIITLTLGVLLHVVFALVLVRLHSSRAEE